MRARTLEIDGFQFALEGRNIARLVNSQAQRSDCFFARAAEFDEIKQGLNIAEALWGTSSAKDFQKGAFSYQFSKDGVTIGRADVPCLGHAVAFNALDRFKQALDAVAARIRNDEIHRVQRY